MVINGNLGLSENVVYPIVPNGFADHYPVFKWLFHWGYTLFSDIPIWRFGGLEHCRVVNSLELGNLLLVVVHPTSG